MSAKHVIAKEMGGYDDELWEQKGGRVNLLWREWQPQWLMGVWDQEQEDDII